MACLEELQANVAEILAIMQMGQSCCDEQDVTDGDRYTDRVEDGVGDVPQNIIDAGYAEDSADWEGFADYKCMISHVAVNQLTARLNQLGALVNQYGAVAGAAAAVGAILAVIFGTGGLAIVFGMVAGVGAVSLLYEALMDFPSLENLSAKVTTNHDELVCAIYQADGDVGALVALNDKIDELFSVPEALILKNMNMGVTLKSLYSGRYDQQDIADQLLNAKYELDDFECDLCSETTDAVVRYDMNGGLLGSWHLTAGTLVAQDDYMFMYHDAHPQHITVCKKLEDLNADFSLGFTNMYVRKITFKYMFYDFLPGYTHHTNNLVCVHAKASGQAEAELWHQYFDGTKIQNTWYDQTLEGSDLGWLETEIIDPTLCAILFGANSHNVHNSPLFGMAFDDITIWIDEA